MSVRIISGLVWVARWPPFEKELLTVLFVFSIFVVLVISRFGFVGWRMGSDCFSSWSLHTFLLLPHVWPVWHL